MRWTVGICAVAAIAGIAATLTIPAQTITPDEATLKLFPPDIQGIASFDAAALRNSSLIQELLQKQSYPRAAQDFFDATGVQPFRDVDKVTVALGSKLLAIVEARYDRFKVEQYLQNQGAASETYLGRVLYSPNAQQFGSISFIDHMVLAGDTAMLKQVIDRLAAPAPNVLENAALMEMIRKSESGNQVWVVGLNADALANSSVPAPVPPQFQDILKSLASGSYQMRITQDVHVKAIGNFANSDSARTSADLLRGLIALARTQAAPQPDVVHLLDGVRVDNAGSLMTIQIDMPGDLLKTLQPKRLAELAR